MVHCHCIPRQLTQKRMEFMFGSAVSAWTIMDPTKNAYRDVFYRNFEWGVLENALKWAAMEHTRVIHDSSIVSHFQLAVLRRKNKSYYIILKFLVLLFQRPNVWFTLVMCDVFIIKKLCIPYNVSYTPSIYIVKCIFRDTSIMTDR